MAPVQDEIPIAVISAVGFTTIVNVCAAPLQVFETGVTIKVAVTGTFNVLTAENALMVPDPLAARPMDVVLFVQLYYVPVTGDPLNTTTDVSVPLHTTWLGGRFTEGVGFTLTVTVNAVGLVHPLDVNE